MDDNYDDEDDYADFDEYDYDSDEYINHHGYDDLYDDVQEDFGYDAWELASDDLDDCLIPSDLRDYHPTWKKSEKTFLDVYIVTKKTEELLDVSREKIVADIEDFDKKMVTILEDLKTIQTVSKKRSTTMLSKVIHLPDLIIENIFTKIVESYKCHFDLFGPEEMPWKYEDQDDDNVAEVCYSATSEFYQYILNMFMTEGSGFDLNDLKDNCDDDEDGWGVKCGGCANCDDSAPVQRSSKFELAITTLCNDMDNTEIKSDSPAEDG